jgi:hypothetical protein
MAIPSDGCVARITLEQPSLLPDRHFIRMLFLTDLAPLILRASSTALLMSAWKLTKPLSCTTSVRRKAVTLSLPYTNRGKVSYESEDSQEPNYHCDNDDDIENFFDGGLHRDVAVNNPEDHPNGNQNNN